MSTVYAITKSTVSNGAAKTRAIANAARARLQLNVFGIH